MLVQPLSSSLGVGAGPGREGGGGAEGGEVVFPRHRAAAGTPVYSGFRAPPACNPNEVESSDCSCLHQEIKTRKRAQGPW